MGDDTVELSTSSAARSKAKPAYRAGAARYRSKAGLDAQAKDLSNLLTLIGRDVVCVLDGELHCLHLSTNWQSVSGFAAEEDVGDAFRSRIAPDHLRKVTHYLAADDVLCPPVRFQLKHRDGHWQWCELQLGNTLSDAKGENLQYQCILRDVTDLIATQAKLEKAKLEAELAIKSRSEFLANMSHELRTPLNAILGFAQMMENGTFGELGHPKYYDYVGSIQQSGMTLLSKINDLLQIATINSGRMDLNEAPIDVTELIRHALEFHSHRAFSEQITLRDRLPKTPIYATVDRIRLLQVMTNVLSNAIRYNQAGGNVDVGCTLRKDGGISIIVEDDGGGIPPGHLQNILSAFRQDNSFYARSRDCVGLGLALSKEIVKLHQGRIDIESEHGKGTHLTIRLPKERTRKAPKPKTLEPAGLFSVN